MTVPFIPFLFPTTSSPSPSCPPSSPCPLLPFLSYFIAFTAYVSPLTPSLPCTYTPSPVTSPSRSPPSCSLPPRLSPLSRSHTHTCPRPNTWIPQPLTLASFAHLFGSPAPATHLHLQTLAALLFFSLFLCTHLLTHEKKKKRTYSFFLSTMIYVRLYVAICM